MFEKEFHFFMKAIYYSKIIDDIIIAVVLSSLVIWVGGYFLKIKNLYKIIATVIAVILSILIVPIPYKREIEQATEKKIEKYNKAQDQYQAAKAVFDEQCKKAGEKIYRTVDNVDGIMLLKVWRENDSEDYWGKFADPMWEYAAWQASGETFFIRRFLFKDNQFEDSIVAGYHYVDVMDNGQFVHHTGEFNGKRIDNESDVQIIPKSYARYAVTFETDVNPELRKYWVAGVTFKILDLQTNEILAEKTRFVFDHGLGSTATARLPWEQATACNNDNKNIYSFVLSVLKPQL